MKPVRRTVAGEQHLSPRRGSVKSVPNSPIAQDVVVLSSAPVSTFHHPDSEAAAPAGVGSSAEKWTIAATRLKGMAYLASLDPAAAVRNFVNLVFELSQPVEGRFDTPTMMNDGFRDSARADGADGDRSV